jgi:hypothetical protein
MYLLCILLGFIFFGGIAMTVNEGFWSNTISFLLICLAGLLAIVGGVPLGQFIIDQAGAGDDKAWHCVFAGVWGVFVLSLTLMRILAEMASRTRVKFVPPLEKAAGPLMGLLVAIMFTSFAAYTMARIPVSAGEWKYSGAAGWEKATFTYASAPFHNVMKRFAEAEGIQSDFFPQSQ